MKNQELQLSFDRVFTTFDQFIALLEQLGSPRQVMKAKTWKHLLENNPSVDEVNEVWRQVQEIGAHMDYFDIADHDYNIVADHLRSQMLDLVAAVRRQKPE